jgi:hypothetical protein
MVRFEPYVAILGGASEGYVVVCQSEYVGLKRKILVQTRAGMENMGASCMARKVGPTVIM